MVKDHPVAKHKLDWFEKFARDLETDCKADEANIS